MSELTLQIDDNRTAFRPGERVTGTATWSLDDAADWLEVRLLWFTRGKGTQDASTVGQHHIQMPPRTGHEKFSLKLPEGPYSFSGKLISLVWALELVMPKGKEATRVDFFDAPTATEIELGDPAEVSP